MEIAITSSDLVLSFLGKFPHPLFEIASELFVLSLEQDLHVAGCFLIFVLRAQSLDTWSEASLEMIFETRTRQFAVDVDIARAKLERTIDQIQSFPCEGLGQKRAVIIRTVSIDLSRHDDFRERLVRELQMRIRFVVFEQYIESRLVLLDEIRFEDQSLDLVIDDD